MIKYRVDKGPPLLLDLDKEIYLTKLICDVFKTCNYKCISYNICRDHIHLIIVCHQENLPRIIQRIKSETSRKFNKKYLSAGPMSDNSNHARSLWSQKFFRVELNKYTIANLSKIPGYLYNDSHLEKAMRYIYHNRKKHGLPDSEVLSKITDSFTVSVDFAFDMDKE